MKLDGTKIGQVLAVLAHIASIPPAKRAEKERFWATSAETALTRLWFKIPPHLRDLAATIDVTIGRLTPSTEAPEEPPKEKEDGSTDG